MLCYVYKISIGFFQLPCRAILCPVGQHFENGRCAVVLRDRNLKLAYTLIFRLCSIEPIIQDLACALLPNIETAVKDNIISKIKRNSEIHEVYLQFDRFDAVVLPSMDGRTLGAMGAEIEMRLDDSVMISIDISILSRTTDIPYVDKELISAREATYKVRTDELRYTFQASIDDDISRVSNVNNTNICRFHNVSGMLAVIPYKIVGDILTCKQVELKSNEFEILNSTHISILQVGVNLSISSYALIRDNARVCINYTIHENKCTAIPTTITYDKRIAAKEKTHIVNVISCSALSSVCVLIALAIYCVSPKYQTPTGKINMCLFIILLIATFLNILATQMNAKDIQCTVMGVAIHYISLLYFACMNTCFVHFYISVRQQTVGDITQQSTSFKRYIIYTVTIPGLIIGVTLMMNLLVFGQSGYGLSGHTCMPLTHTGTFVFPMFILVVSNNVIHALSLLHNRYKSRNSTDNMVSPTCDGPVQMICLKKLLILVNLTSLLQLTHTIMQIMDLKNDVIDYTASALSNLHGVFIIIASLCNNHTYYDLKRSVMVFLGIGIRTPTSELKITKLQTKCTDHSTVEQQNATDLAE